MSEEFRLGGELAVKRIGFGTMRLLSGRARGPETARAVLRRAVELGVNHIDTAYFYVSDDGAIRINTLINEALYPYPPGLVVATKVGPTYTPRRGYVQTTDPAVLRPMVEANLETLGVDSLDLVYLRIGLMGTPHGESLGARYEALATLREEGLIRHLGLSNVDADHLAQARAIAPVAAVQNQFHSGDHDGGELVALCEQADIAFVPFFPLSGGRGAFSGRRIAKVAARRSATVSQVALAWLLASSPAALAIPGTGSIAHLEENVAAGSVCLTQEDLSDLA
jgi:aryl-alcohol dehydrogenase-like predicted oxidoreductase